MCLPILPVVGIAPFLCVPLLTHAYLALTVFCFPPEGSGFSVAGVDVESLADMFNGYSLLPN